jgi:hypothetical protein
MTKNYYDDDNSIPINLKANNGYCNYKMQKKISSTRVKMSALEILKFWDFILIFISSKDEEDGD